MTDVVVVQNTGKIGWCRGCDVKNRALKSLRGRRNGIPKLAIVILLLAALLFLVAPNLSWAKCNGPRRESGTARSDLTSAKKL
jgi:hypothetical protein